MEKVDVGRFTGQFSSFSDENGRSPIVQFWGDTKDFIDNKEIFIEVAVKKNQTEFIRTATKIQIK